MRGLPRFGAGSNFSALFSENNEESSEYISGLVFLAVFFFIIFLMWGISLLIFVCVGKKKVGVLAGGSFPMKTDPRLVLGIRIFFLICCLLVIIYSSLFLTRGVRSMKNAITLVKESNNDALGIVQEGIDVTDSLFEIQEFSVRLNQQVAATFGDFCAQTPLVETTIEEETGYNFEIISKDVKEQLEVLINVIDTDVQNIRNGLDNAENGLMDVEETIESYDQLDAVAYVLVTLLLFHTCCFFIGTCVIMLNYWTDTIQYCLAWVLLPSFVVLLVFCWCGCSMFATAAALNADFCSGGEDKSPGGTLIQIMDLQDIDRSDFLYEATEYYVKGCNSDFPFDFITEYQDEIVEAQNLLIQLRNELQTFVDQSTILLLTALCRQDFQTTLDLLLDADAQMEQLRVQSNRTEFLLSCDNIVPVYTKVAHDGACTSSPYATSWFFASLLRLCVFGMLMVTLRSAFQSIEEEEPIGDYMDDEAEAEFQPTLQRRSSALQGSVYTGASGGM